MNLRRQVFGVFLSCKVVNKMAPKETDSLSITKRNRNMTSTAVIDVHGAILHNVIALIKCDCILLQTFETFLQGGFDNGSRRNRNVSISKYSFSLERKRRIFIQLALNFLQFERF